MRIDIAINERVAQPLVDSSRARKHREKTGWFKAFNITVQCYSTAQGLRNGWKVDIWRLK